MGFLFLALQDKRKTTENTKNEGCLQKKKIKKNEISLVLVLVMISYIKNEPPPYDEGFVINFTQKDLLWGYNV